MTSDEKLTNTTSLATDADDPNAGMAAAPADQQKAAAAAGDAKPVYFNFQLHRQAQKIRKQGLWADLGERFGNLEVRLREFHHEAVVVAREAKEEQIRMQLGLSEDQDLPNEKGLEVTREAVRMAVVGVRGHLLATDDQVQVARAAGVEIEKTGDGPVLHLTGAESEKVAREILWPVIQVSMPFMTALVAIARTGLKRVEDKVVVELGEGFVYGRHVGAGSDD